MILLLLVLFSLALVGTAVFLARYQTRSYRQPIVRTPDDYGMDYEDVSFRSTDGLNIRGWFIPGEARDKVTIMTQPFPFNRHGFLSRNQGFPRILKVDVDTLTTARALHDDGHSVLMFDFRNHAERHPEHLRRDPGAQGAHLAGGPDAPVRYLQLHRGAPGRSAPVPEGELLEQVCHWAANR